MKQKIYIKPTKSSLIAGIIAVVLMLAFGIVFLVLLADEDSTVGMVFMSFWILFILLIGGIFLYKYKNYNNTDSADEAIFSSDENNEELQFDEKLRKLEALFKENLITEFEYRKKRAEILQSRW